MKHSYKMIDELGPHPKTFSFRHIKELSFMARYIVDQDMNPVADEVLGFFRDYICDFDDADENKQLYFYNPTISEDCITMNGIDSSHIHPNEKNLMSPAYETNYSTNYIERIVMESLGYIYK